MTKNKKGKQRAKNLKTHLSTRKRKIKAQHLHNKSHKNHQRKNNQIKKVNQRALTNQE
jgi:hypothetical protein